ncbi:hypothetical protein IQ238_11825 [Pleurocapsales cyanobacterium LEGE 06147]|nr:hypothetical protein [Pleurocapsales cyanobacterium LEGE 06147]
MLKLTYTENGFYLEYLTESLENWVAKRTLLCLRTANSIYIEPSTASFLLSVDLAYLSDVEALRAENGKMLDLTICGAAAPATQDREWIEVSLKGTWITDKEDSQEGIFVCVLSEGAETCLYELWKQASMEALTTDS